MKRRDEIELRRASRQLVKTRRAAEYALNDADQADYRLRRALQSATEDGGLSETAKTFLETTRTELVTFRHQRYVADVAYDKAVNSLALLLGVQRG